MRDHEGDYSVSSLCSALGISRSGYYAWRRREPSARDQADEELLVEIRSIYEESHRTYGAPRVHAALRHRGIRVGKKRVARLMRVADLQGVSRRRRQFKTTVRGRAQHGIPDLVDRTFVADGPDRLWVADITYVPTLSSWLYLAVVVDVFSRRVVGWAMASHLRTELVMEALEMALFNRRPEDPVIHHSDQGCQYTSIAFGRRCEEAGVRPSVGSAGDCYDNALCESFFATLECELFDQNTFRTHGDAKLAIFSFIEAWYNLRRLHSALGFLSPAEFEARHAGGMRTAVPSPPTGHPQGCQSPPRPPSDPASIGVAGGSPTAATMTTTTIDL